MNPIYSHSKFIIMLQATIIGNVGADAQFKEESGRKFTTFRVAHNDTYTDQSGQQHTSSIWVDCILNDHPKVAQFLKAGQLVYVSGHLKTRVYSSEKDRCMKAGLSISVQRIELLGGSSDAVPSRLYDKDGVQHDVAKWFLTNVKDTTLVSQRGQRFTVDKKGWVIPEQAPAISSTTNAETHDAEPDRSGEGAPAF